MLDDESADPTLTEDSGQDTAEVDWQKRYTDTQAEYTRNQQALSDERKVWEDEQALLARVQEKFPHLLAEEEEETEDDDGLDDDTPDLSQFATKKELEEFKTWRAGIDGERSNQMFERDLKRQIDLAEEIVDDDVRSNVHDWIKDRTLSLGGTPKHLEQAVKEFRSITGQLGSQKKPKPRAPHVPKGGSPGTGVKDFSQMSRSEIDEYMVERARALEA